MKITFTKILRISLILIFVTFVQSCKDPCEKLICLNSEICIDGACIELDDKCKDVDCFNYGVCDNGECICKNGYEGEDCSFESRTRLIGTWTYLNGCFGKTISTKITFSSQAANKIFISNIIDDTLGGSVYAIVDVTKITIPSQSVIDSDGDTWTIQGLTTGHFSYNSFSINVKYTFLTITETCLLTFNKQ